MVPGHLRQRIGLAVSAAEQEDERVARKRLDRYFARSWNDAIGQAAVGDHGVGGDAEQTGGRDDARAEIAETVDVGRERDLRLEP